MVILDTDHISILERVSSPEKERLLQQLDSTSSLPPTVAVISYEEQVRGWLACVAACRSMLDLVNAYRELLRQLQNYCAWKIMPFSELAATKYQELRKKKLRVGSMDLRIAAIALSHDATLLSRNLLDFRRIPGLKVEDWTR
jgi:tRNA(fMet)-specific endonuclease VapC